MTTIRKLKENSVECFFEKENIWTFDSKGELLITIMSSIAQEESRSISENVTWGHRKRFSDGKAMVPFGRFLGFERGEDGNLVVNQEQAKTVKLIYKLFLEGLSPYKVAKKLTEMGIPTPGGKEKWSQSCVRSILTNEKYKGDALLQKVFTTDYLTKKKKKNEGEVPQYYVEDNHEAIIDAETFDLVQMEMARRKAESGRYSGVGIFASKIRCGECGNWYGSKVWHSTDKYRRVIYQCNHKFKNEKKYVRMLKALGIAVIFEKENINTSTMNSEMILTVLSAFAQAESESISQNVARGKRMGFRQGKFPFPYRQILGYRKGSDGKPEIIPEEAEVIRMIFNSYLQGASLQTIKKRLEADGVLTARGNKKWSSESVQRILQNEKYCGDVLLQKTFIEDVLTGVSKKNTGQLPQYYIENNHEGIVTKQTFREAQAEIARRNSKSATNHRKRHRGRYNSKYALSERLVCGDCGSSYKRVTWSIHGRKQIVWRCVNRLEYGTKFCSNSPSIPETELHQAILKAVQNLAAKFTGEVADQLNGILHQIEVGESLTPQLQAQLEQNQQEFDHLLEMSLDFDENTPFLDDKLKRLSDKIKQLKTAITQSSVNSQTPSTPTNPITAKDLLITEYDDMLTARIIEKIIVKSRQDLEIIFIGGYTQQISLQ